MARILKATIALAASGMLASAALANDVLAPEKVVIEDGKFAYSLTGKKGDPEAGRKWFVGTRLGNCLACHANTDTSKELFHGEVGPPLDGAGDRYDEATLRAIIINSKAVFGDQTLMPGFYRVSGLNRVADKFAGKTILTAQQVEDVLAYLMTLKE